MLYWFLNVTKRTCNYLAQKKTALDLSINRGDRRLIIRNDSSQTFFHKLWKRKKKENKNNLTAANQIKEDNTKYFLLLSDRLFLCIPISHNFYFVFLFIKSNKNYFFLAKMFANRAYKVTSTKTTWNLNLRLHVRGFAVELLGGLSNQEIRTIPHAFAYQGIQHMNTL